MVSGRGVIHFGVLKAEKLTAAERHLNVYSVTSIPESKKDHILIVIRQAMKLPAP